MARIQHIAICADDQEKLAEFYKTTFGMTEVFRQEKPFGIYLSDGHINLAILGTHGRPEGLWHFGFQVDSIEQAGQAAAENGAQQTPEATPRDGRFAEAWIKDPVGQRVDLSEKGWRTA